MSLKIVAEVSGNHGGKIENCLMLIRLAKEIGVDAIKFQRFEPWHLAGKRYKNPRIQAMGLKRSDLFELYGKTHTPLGWYHDIKIELNGFPWFCSVFSDEDALFAVHTLGVNTLKIASFELTDLELIKACARTKLPLIISVNSSASQSDIGQAWLAANGAPKTTFLYATEYGFNPTVDLIGIARLRDRLVRGCGFGLSDHSPEGNHTMLDAAMKLDATVVERHIRLPHVDTPDKDFSSTPDDFARYIELARTFERARAIREPQVAASSG